MSARALTTAELRSAAFRGWFLVVTVCAFAGSIVLLVLGWADAAPGGTGDLALPVLGAWSAAVLVRAWRARGRATRHP